MDKGVKHQGHLACARVPRLSPGRAIDFNLLLQVSEALAEKMREHVCAQLSRQLEGFRIPGGRYPDRQFALHGPRKNSDWHFRAIWRFPYNSIPLPQPPNSLDVLEHPLFS